MTGHRVLCRDALAFPFETAVGVGPIAEPHPAARSIHLVDPENLIGGTDLDREAVAAAALAYRAVVDVEEADHVVIASSHHTAFPIWCGWGPARRLVRSGPDGADLALLEVIESENLPARFDRIVIGSGDGIFALAAAKLQTAGATVTVVSRRVSLSSRLRLAVRDIRFLGHATIGITLDRYGHLPPGSEDEVA